MRAALLPTPGDPFLTGYWLRNFRQLWAGEVDQLHVIVNGQNDPDALAYIEEQVAAAAAGMRRPPVLMHGGSEFLGHGEALELLLAGVDADTVMLCEDDAWVRRPGQVAARFAAIEDGSCDVIGSPRGCASAELIELCWARWPDAPMTASCDSGHALWPCFFFARRADLEATDGRFGARIWQPGETVAGIGYTSPNLLSADTLVSTSLQLRGNERLRIRHDPQYRITDPGFIGDWIGHDPPWFHVGSLSSGYGYAFADKSGRVRLSIGGDQTEAREWSRRMYWWERVCETAPADALPDHQAAYWAELDRIIALTGTRALIDEWASLMAPWVTWQE